MGQKIEGIVKEEGGVILEERRRYRENCKRHEKSRDARGKRRKTRKEIYTMKKYPRTETYIEGKGGGKEELVFNCICI